MPNDKTEFDLEKLKTDSQMWMRLAMSVEGSDRLENVFPGTKNPFEEYGEASIEKVRKLADEGKLYVREFGRSRHFRQVEKDGDKLNLGDTKEIRVNTTYSDPALAVLMYLSRAFFKGSAIDRFVDWIGLGSISGWFDKRLEHRRELIDKEERYKQEYNSMTDDQKEKLKELRANEKEVAKIQKELQKQAKLEAEARENLKNLEEQTNSIRRKLNQLQGKEDTGNSNEMTAPLTQPAPPQDQPTMQPILEGDPNQLDKKQEQPPQDTKKTEQEEKKKGITLVSGDKVYTAENLNELPEEVRKMLEMIQKVIEQMETQKKQEQLQQNPQSTDLQNEQEQQQQQQQQPPQTELNAVNNEEQQIVNENAENPPLNPQGENEQEQQQQQQQLQTELNAVNNEEPAIVNQTEENPRTNLQDENEQLQEQAEAVPEDWRDMIANALFSHGQGGDLMEQYQQVKDDRENSAIFLAGAIYGVLKASTLDPEGNQKMLEDIFNGRSLGDEKNDLIRAGLDTAQNAMQKSNEQNDNTQMEEMLTTAVKHLKEFAGDGNAVTPQRAMAIMMVSLAEGLALDLGLQLPQEEVAPKENLPNPEEQEELQEVDLQPLFHDVEEEPQAETNVPLNQPAEIEPGQVNIQPEPEQPEQEEIPENEQAVPEDWRDVLVKALFSHENGVDLLAQYQQVKDNPLDSAVFLASAIFGVLKENIIDRESNQNLLEQIFNGRSLGNGNDDLVRSGLESAQDAMRKCEAQEDLQPLEKMLTIAVRELKEYAGDGNEPTPQQAMAAMMAELAEGFARDFGVQLPQEEVLQQNEQPQAETDVPLNQPTEIEPEQVNIQPEPEQPEQIREEKQEKAQPEGWRDVLLSALFSHQKGSDLLAQYQEIKDDPLTSMLFLAGTVFGLLKQNITGPESNQQLMEEILSGRSLGDDRDEMIRAGMDSAKDALAESFGENNSKPLEEMLTTAVRELKGFAGDGNNRTPQQELAGMMIEMAEEMAKDHGLQLPQEETVQQLGDQQPQAQQAAPLAAPPNMEADKIKIQNREPEQQPLTLPERLEAERKALEAAKHWRDTMSNSLFSYQGGEDLKNGYTQMRRNARDASDYLTLTVMGLIANGPQKNGGEQNHKEMMDALLDGRPLGAEQDNFVRGAANRAKELMQNPNLEQTKDLLADAVRGLGWQAAEEPNLSGRHVMIGMLITSALTMATQKGLNLTLGDTDNRIVKCAAEMGKIALSYGNARQYFGSHPLDQTDETCRTQLQNLLAGNAVDKAIKLDRKEGQNGVTNTHTLIGGGAWTEANLRTMSQTSRVRTGITPQQLEQMLERPDGKIAQKAGYSVGKEMSTGAQTLLSGNQLDLHQKKTLAQAILDPQVQPNQFMG